MKARFGDGTALRVPIEIANQVSSYLDRAGISLESGGIILGTRAFDSPIYEIRKITFPSAMDRRARFHYVRSKTMANVQMWKCWLASGGKVCYLGEWHTHNESWPSPSDTDRELIRDIAENARCPLDRIFLIIFGNSDVAYVGMALPQSDGDIIEEAHIRWRG